MVNRLQNHWIICVAPKLKEMQQALTEWLIVYIVLPFRMEGVKMFNIHD